MADNKRKTSSGSGNGFGAEKGEIKSQNKKDKNHDGKQTKNEKNFSENTQLRSKGKSKNDPSSLRNQVSVASFFILAFVIAVFLIAGIKGIEEAPLLEVVCRVMYGLFGYGAYAAIIVLVGEGIMWKECIIKGKRAFKLIWGFLLTVFTSALIHSFTSQTSAISALWGNGSISDGGVCPGGVFGGLVWAAFDKLLGYAWLVVVFLFIFFIISLMVYLNITPLKAYNFINSLAGSDREPESDEIIENYESEKERKRLERKAEKERRRAEREAEELEELEREDRERALKLAEKEEKERLKAEEQERKKAEQKEAERKEAERLHSESRSKIDFNFDEPEEEEPAKADEDKEKGSAAKSAYTEPVTTEVDYEDIDVDSIFTDEFEHPCGKGESGKEEFELPFKVDKETGEVIDGELDLDGASDDDDEGDEILIENESIESVPSYVFPPIELLAQGEAELERVDNAELTRNGERLIEVLASFNVKASIVNISQGPTITRYELAPGAGVRVSKIATLVDDIALNLATSGVRIEAPIPGKAAVGIEVPNSVRSTVYLRDLIESDKFKNSKSKLTACLGKDVAGAPVIIDIAKMPHLLVAGATGMGKSVALNSILLSLLYKSSPDELKLILIDPKKVEMKPYNNLPHLLMPVVNNPKKAAGALSAAVTEMERRFELIEAENVRDIKGYNNAIANFPEKEYLPHMVIAIDELADLMLTAKDTVEDSICRIAQKARAAGIHLILCTQRPSVDVITGLIKANIPSRIALTVASLVDSKTIIDIGGAEKLISKGDMLFAPVDAMKPMRAQGAFVSDSEVESVTNFIKNQSKTNYNDEFIKHTNAAAEKCDTPKKGAAADVGDDADLDPKLWEACDVAYETGKISTSLLQRRLALGYGRAAKIIDKMQELGIVSAPEGQKPRSVIMPREDYLAMRMHDDGAPGGFDLDGEDFE